MANVGSTVQIRYRGFLDDGTVFDSTDQHGGTPLEFVVGSGQVIPGFDNAVKEMELGEKRTIHIPAAQAYGEYREDMVLQIPCSELPNWQQLPVGQQVMLQTSRGPMQCKVAKIENETAYFDLNHELAGKDLNFDLELVGIR